MVDVFDSVIELPDPEMQRQFRELVGLEFAKEQLEKLGRIMVNPAHLERWSKKNHGGVLPAVARFNSRPPLIVFEGDVGTGKSTLASSFPDAIARKEKKSITVYRLSLMTRGSGAVGEMTKLVTGAFHKFESALSSGVGSSGRASVLIIDEADALAQSREFEQMHHEDRAGVNALIRGIDNLTAKNSSAFVVMCTNRVGALDPAVLRRASAIYTFLRPNESQRETVFRNALEGALSDSCLRDLTQVTGATNSRKYGFTYSDLTNRLIPDIILEAFPDSPITSESAIKVAKRLEPTKPFGDEQKR